MRCSDLLAMRTPWRIWAPSSRSLARRAPASLAALLPADRGRGTSQSLLPGGVRGGAFRPESVAPPPRLRHLSATPRSAQQKKEVGVAALEGHAHARAGPAGGTLPAAHGIDHDVRGSRARD